LLHFILNFKICYWRGGSKIRGVGWPNVIIFNGQSIFSWNSSGHPGHLTEGVIFSVTLHPYDPWWEWKEKMEFMSDWKELSERNLVKLSTFARPSLYFRLVFSSNWKKCKRCSIYKCCLQMDAKYNILFSLTELKGNFISICSRAFHS